MIAKPVPAFLYESMLLAKCLIHISFFISQFHLISTGWLVDPAKSIKILQNQSSFPRTQVGMSGF